MYSSMNASTVSDTEETLALVRRTVNDNHSTPRTCPHTSRKNEGPRAAEEGTT
jgi:hypothetical protein